VGQARDYAQENGDRLANEKGEKGGSDTHTTPHEPANSENNDFDSHSHSTNANPSLEVDTSHRSISWSRTQATGDVES
jgi:hypothetical protein